MRSAWLLLPLLAALLAACGDETSPDDQVDPTRLQAGAVDRSLDVDFTLAAEGAGRELVDDFLFDDAGGTLTFAGLPRSVVIYERIEWPAYDYILFQGLAVSPGEWLAFWLYCTVDSDESAWFWYEGTSGLAMTAEQVSGTCTSSTTPSRGLVRLPATDMPIPALLARYTIGGAALRLGRGEPGLFELDGASYEVFPFGEVDCTTCATDGWWEVHSLFRRPGRAEVGFTIFYLYENGDPMQNAYSVLLPHLTDPLGDNHFAGTWTRTP